MTTADRLREKYKEVPICGVMIRTRHPKMDGWDSSPCQLRLPSTHDGHHQPTPEHQALIKKYPRGKSAPKGEMRVGGPK